MDKSNTSCSWPQYTPDYGYWNYENIYENESRMHTNKSQYKFHSYHAFNLTRNFAMSSNSKPEVHFSLEIVMQGSHYLSGCLNSSLTLE